MINFTAAIDEADLAGILQLQKENLPGALTKVEIQTQGFLTVKHSLELLKSLNDIEKHIIGKDGDKVVAYLLAMTKKSEKEIPVLFPLFEKFRKIQFKNKPVSDYNYLVVGQVCVHKSYRGQGILDNCYAAYRDYYKEKYTFAITEIANSNQRSQNAHKRIGFTEIHQYENDNGGKWNIVIWDWRNGK